jgi:hypothetical protein
VARPPFTQERLRGAYDDVIAKARRVIGSPASAFTRKQK